MPREAEDLTGRRFGSRRVIRQAKSKKYGRYQVLYWLVECLNCGRRTKVQGSSLRRGASCRYCGPPLESTDRKKMQTPRRSMTAKELAALLREIPPETSVYIHLNSPRGWVNVPILRATHVPGIALVLLADAPNALHPHRRKVQR